MKAISCILECALAYALAALMTLMVLDVTWQVVTRFILQDPSSYTEELARYLLMWIGFLGSAYAYRKRSHLALDLLLVSVAEARRPRLIRISHLACLLFAAAVMVYGGINLMSLTLTLDQTSAALGVPIGLVYLCIPLSGVLICWFAFEAMVHPTFHLHEPLPED